MKYLLQAIEARREHIRLGDPELRRLLTDVRKGRDEREEFLESIDRILTELRNYTEHSQAFLNRVSKREAPDYYDVIKHPMDLSTMQKKVKAGSYKNKKQFAHDLDLIWDNCLTYNSDPNHRLRRNVQFMRKKANHLLDFVSDKSDVKDVLSQWEANEVAAAAEAAAAAAGGPGAGDTMAASHGTDAASTPREGMAKDGGIEGVVSPAVKRLGSQLRRPSSLSFTRTSTAASPDVPFEQRPALIRTVEGMSMFDTLDRALSRFEAAAFDVPQESEAGPSSRPMNTASLAITPVTPGSANTCSVAEMHGAAQSLKALENEAHTNPLDVAIRLAPAAVVDDGDDQDEPITVSTSANMDNQMSTGAESMDVDPAASTTASTDPAGEETQPNGHLVRPEEQANGAASSELDIAKPPQEPMTTRSNGKEKAKPLPPYPNPLETGRAEAAAQESASWGEDALPRSMPGPMAWWTACTTDSMISNGMPALPASCSEVVLVSTGGKPADGHRKAKRRRIVKSWRPAITASSANAPEATVATGDAAASLADGPAQATIASDIPEGQKASGTTSETQAQIDPIEDGDEQMEDEEQARTETQETPQLEDDAPRPAATSSAPAPPAIGVRDVRGMRAKIEGNIATVIHLRKIHRKFGALAAASEMDAPIPAWLTTTSSDEESDDPPSDDADSDTESGQQALPPPSYHRQGLPTPPPGHSYEAPYASLTASSSRASMKAHVQTMLAHVGFEGAHSAPVDVLTHVAMDFLLSMGRTLRLYADRCANQMSAEEMLLHSLRENGAGDVPSLEAYIKDDVERYGMKLTELLRKLRQSYKDQLNSTDRGAIQDDALFANDGAAFQSGFFMEELGDDYLGFKALGLDHELGVSGLSIPSRLFHGRSIGNRAAPEDSASAKPSVPFPPPPDFVPLTSGGISLQIGLLQEWYRQRLRERKEERGPTPDPERGSQAGEEEDEEEDDADDEGGDEHGLRGTLEDEEPERTRVKVPPTGRIPRRTMWDPAAKDGVAGAGAGAGAGTAAAAAGGATTAGGAKGGSGSAVGDQGNGGGKKRKGDAPMSGKGGHTTTSKKKKKDLVAAAA